MIASTFDFTMVLLVCSLLLALRPVNARQYEIHPAISETEEEFEKLANRLKPGDELILHPGTYSQLERRAITVAGTLEHPIVIRAADLSKPATLTRPGTSRQNNIEFVDCAHLVIRGIQFKGGSSGVRFIRGHHIVFEDCEILETSNNALTMNSGDCSAFTIRRNHIHHTGLATGRPTEGEGMYIGCHDGSCRTTDSVIEGNYIHHLRGTSNGGNDGIEIKVGSFNNIVRNNVIHDTNIEKKYPGIFVYGGGPGTNVVEGNVIWNAGEGIQVVSDALVRNNIIFACEATGISAAPHGAMPQVRNTTIINNTIHGCPVGIRMRWAVATNVVLANNAIYCAGTTAVDASESFGILKNNFVAGTLKGVSIDSAAFYDGGEATSAFLNASNKDFWPKPTLRGQAAQEWTPPLDFNDSTRSAPSDVGAYESSGQEQNPGWKIEAGFKK